MIEKRICAEEKIITAYLNCPAAGVKTGTLVTMSGAFSVDSGPTGKAGKPGYAKAGALMANAITYTGEGANTRVVGFVDKLHFSVDDSDLTKDTLVSGQQCLVYTEGYFDTDQYNSTLFAAAVATGALLYTDNSGLLHTGNASSTLTPRAIFWGFKGTSTATFDSNYMNSGFIYVQLINPNV